MGWEIFFASGLIGALSGGAVSLISQSLQHKRILKKDRQDKKLNLYSTIIQFGPLAIDNIDNLNIQVSIALLYAESELEKELKELMRIVTIAQASNWDTLSDQQKVPFITQVQEQHEKILPIMKKEVGLE